MLTVIRKTLKLCLYALIVIVGIVFCVSNRSRLELTLFPLPYGLTLPVFLFAILIFVAGLITGRFIGGMSHFKTRKLHKAANERVSALENEITAVRSEKLLRNS
ncbi:MAG TPA: lipopolysaccharide assembly protein LapA domain-containing protein [Rickettsiales bacterium]|nr:lipopolysaccharide assembly protein LapA domain-containing protein [Rickettsiales bacterium]